MSKSSSKYITLISNSSHDYFPDNKPNKFSVKLSEELRFENASYEVCLREIHLPTAYINIRENVDNHFYVRVNNSKSPNSFKSFYCFIKAGFYESIETLVTELNNVLDLKPVAQVEYDSIRRKVSIKASQFKEDEFLYIKLPYGLSRALGFDGEKFKDIELTFDKSNVKEAGKLPLLNIDQVYVYSNIVEPSIVSDFRAHLLRVVNISGSKGRYITKEFQKPVYIPLQSSVIRSIDIEITTNDGNLFNLDGDGPQVLLVLHFRKKSPFAT